MVAVEVDFQSAFPQDGNNKGVGRDSDLCQGSTAANEKDELKTGWKMFLNVTNMEVTSAKLGADSSSAVEISSHPLYESPPPPAPHQR